MKYQTESWLSGRKRFTANEVRVYSPSRVRIPHSPQTKLQKAQLFGVIVLRESEGFERRRRRAPVSVAERKTWDSRVGVEST